jgi:putative peptide zinc metalloprotease protein
MQSQHLKLRMDLIVSEVKHAGKIHCVVKDPVTRRYFRFREHEYFIIRQLDGLTPLEEIQARFEREFEMPLSVPTLQHFVDRVEALCLVDAGLGDQEITRLQLRASTEQRILNKLLQFRLKALDPDRFFNALIPHIRFFFTWQFVALTGILTLVAISITLLRWNGYAGQVKDLFRPEAIPTFLFVAMVVTILHEFAHGLTCKYYGGEVHEIGFLLIYLLPAFYCNVSDAWLFGEKTKRLWVSAAGTVFQLFLFAIAAIVWLFIDPRTWLSQACALTIAVAGLTALFNFNPLIKLDGYYLLSDYLAIPNLRKRAFAYLGSEFKSLFLRGVRKPDGLTGRERRIYLIYGVLAGLYSLGLLVFVVFRIVAFGVSLFH